MDAKLQAITPTYPVLPLEQRAANPPSRVPFVLHHPLTGKKGLYGMNAGTFIIFPKNTLLSQTEIDHFELSRNPPKEHSSVQREWRDLLPFVTQERFTVRWDWRP